VLVEIGLTRLIVLGIEQSVEGDHMVEIGYKLSSEEHGPLGLVCYARQAEEASFSFASISDHYHPWIDAQGQSPFVWCTLGGISQVTSKMNITTGATTCPTVRIPTLPSSPRPRLRPPP
jgi:alkanesulfonate monooxygenase SsuD/methylene tetrahydromethanopterin reductase-like flavin-dependent oxidoreductase (luciferase family)